LGVASTSTDNRSGGKGDIATMTRPAYDNALPIARREVSNLVEQFDTPLYPPLLDADGNLAATITVRQGTAAELDLIVLADGELAIENQADRIAVRVGDGELAGGITCSQWLYVAIDDRFAISASLDSYLAVVQVAADVPSLRVSSDSSGEEIALEFPSLESGTYVFRMAPVPGDSIVPAISVKTTTGNPTDTVQGMMVINTFDNTLRMYADGGWRTLATW